MDTVNIGTMFLKGIVSKILNSTLKKKLGCEVTTRLNEFNATLKDDRVRLHLNIDAEMSQDELKNLLTKLSVGM